MYVLKKIRQAQATMRCALAAFDSAHGASMRTYVLRNYNEGLYGQIPNMSYDWYRIYI
jgi:hypothetical protein